MGVKIYRTCQILKWGNPYASCTLLTDKKGKYIIEVTLDADDLFVDFNVKFEDNIKPETAIKYFEDECINRFTCYGEFSVAQVKINSGEEIAFS